MTSKGDILGVMFMQAVITDDPMQDLERGLDEDLTQQEWEWAESKAEEVSTILSTAYEALEKLENT